MGSKLNQWTWDHWKSSIWWNFQHKMSAITLATTLLQAPLPATNSRNILSDTNKSGDCCKIRLSKMNAIKEIKYITLTS